MQKLKAKLPRLFLYLPLVMLNCFNAFGVDIPSFARPVNLLNNGLESNIANPIITYNNNLGRVNTSFSVNLPTAKFDIRKKLKFSYNSQSFFNLGYGIGFELGLPRIFKAQQSDRADYIFDTGSSILELKETDNGLIELSLKQFNRYTRFSDGSVEVLTRSGKLQKFNNTGNIIEERSVGKNNIITYDWNESVLSSISLPNNQRATLSYKTCSLNNSNIQNSEMEIYFKGQWIDQTKCLDKIEFNDSVVEFHYNTYRNLVNAEVVGGLFPLFKAEYSFLAGTKENRLHESSYKNNGEISGSQYNKDSVVVKIGHNRLQVFDEAKFFESQKLIKNKIMGFYGSGDVAQLFFADFNNDGITDYLSYKATLSAGSTSHVDNDFWFDSTNIDKPSWGPVTKELKLGRKNLDGNIEFKNTGEFTLSSTFNIAKAESNADHIDDGGGDLDDLKDKTQSGITFETMPIIADFDGNGMVDILLCGSVNKIAYNTKTGFVEEDSNIACPKESISYDLNQDSYSDLITKDSVYLSSGNGFKEVSVYPSSIDAIKKALSDGTLDNGIFDMDFNGAPDILKEGDILTATDFGADKVIDVIKVGDKDSIYSWTIAPAYPVISKLNLSHGGVKAFNYEMQASIPVVSNVTKDNLVGEVTTNEYLYESPFSEAYSDRFMGFGYVTIHELATSNSSGKKVIKQYFKDNSKESVFERVSKHGLVDTEYHCRIDECNSLVNQLQNSSTLNKEWFRIIVKNYKISKPFSDERYHIFLESNYVENFNLNDNANMDSTSADSYLNRIELLNYSDWGPMKTITTKCEDCLITAFGVDDIASYLDQVVSSYEYFDSRVLLSEKVKFSKMNSKKIKYSHKEINYFGNISKGDFTKVEIDHVSDNSDSGWKTITKFNQEALPIEKTYPAGAIVSYFYSNSFKTVELNHNGLYSSIESIDNYGNLIARSSKSKILNRNEQYQYSNDHVLNFAQTDDYTYNIKYTLTGEGLDKKVIVDSLSSSEKLYKTIEMDGFGKKTRNYIQQDGVFHISAETIYDGSNRVSYERSTLLSETLESGLEVSSFQYLNENRLSRSLNIVDGISSEKHYSGSSVSTFTNGKFISEVIKGELDVPHAVRTNSRYLNIEKVLNGELHALGEFQFVRDLRGVIREVRTKAGKLLYEQYSTPNSVIVNLSHEAVLNEFGQITSILDEDEVVQTLDYDELNRLTTVRINPIGFENSVVYNKNNTIKVDRLSLKDKKIQFDNKYDALNNITNHSITLNNKVLRNLEFKYQGGLLTSIPGVIDEVEYNQFGHVSGIFYENLDLSIESFATGKIKNIQMGDVNISLQHNKDGRISHKNIYLINEFKQNIYKYDLDGRVLEKANKADLKRDGNYNLLTDGLEYKDSENGILKSIDGKEVKYKSIDQITAVGDEAYLSEVLHSIDNQLIKYLKLNEKIVGAFTCSEKCTFYPILTDNLNSVVAIFNNEGEQIVSRSYSTWGELTNTNLLNKEAKKIDKLIRYDFAGLIRPYQSKFLVSKTRVYSPVHGQWHKIDPQLFLNPEVFLKDRILESNGLDYVAGDPVNYVDPTGQVGLLGAGIGGIIGGISGGLCQFVANGGVLDATVAISVGSGFLTGAAIGAVGGMPLAGGMSATVAKSTLSSIFAFTGNLMGQVANKIATGKNGNIDISQAAFAGVLGFTGMTFSSKLSGMSKFASGSMNDVATSGAVGISFMPIEVGYSAFASLEDEIKNDSSNEDSFNSNYSLGVDYSFELDVDTSGFEGRIDRDSHFENENSGSEGSEETTKPSGDHR